MTLVEGPALLEGAARSAALPPSTRSLVEGALSSPACSACMADDCELFAQLNCVISSWMRASCRV